MLTQLEADSLIRMQKSFINPRTITLPPGGKESHELVGVDPKEIFALDLWRGALKLTKVKYQNRGRNSIVLVRLDIDGAPHTNPDGIQIIGTHIHVYKEGFEDKWAQPIDPRLFTNPSDIEVTLNEFCSFCNIENVPVFQKGLQ